MRLVFIGCVTMSRELLINIIESKKICVVGIVTKKKSKFNSDHSDLSDTALVNKIAYKYMGDINSSMNINWIKQQNPDIIFCFGWSSLLKKQTLELAPKGVVGFHPAKLPSNRGRHPIIWSLVLGLKETASSFFMMNENPDAGKIISQEKIKIEYSDNANVLYNKIYKVAKKQILQILENLISNNLNLRLNDFDKSNTWRKRSFIDGKIDWRMSSLNIFNLVRGLSKPYPGAHFEHENQIFKVWKCSEITMENTENLEPGKIINFDSNKIVIKTGDNAIVIEEHDFNQKIPEYFK